MLCQTLENIHGVKNVISTCSLGMGIYFLPLKWILNLEASQHSLQHVKTEVRKCAFFSDLSSITTKC